MAAPYGSPAEQARTLAVLADLAARPTPTPTPAPAPSSTHGRNCLNLDIAAMAPARHDEVMRTVVFVVFDDLQLLDLAGPVDVLGGANEMGADPPYRPLLASADGRPVRSNAGVEVTVDASLEQVRRRRGPIDSLVVVGGSGADRAARDPDLCRDVAALGRRADRTISVCTGALVLAAAGLLDGRRVTTHWATVDQLAEEHPSVEVEPDLIFVQDRGVWSSAGVTAGIDLFLALVDADHGAELAHEIARDLVVFVRRPGGQSQFSAQLRSEPARSPALAELQRWLTDHLDEDLTVPALARRAGLSQRQFARAFAAEVGTTPAVYVENLRLEAARRLLETSDLTVETVAKTVGMSLPETLYRAFRRRLGTTPDQYRKHWNSSTRRR
jgi:transcriptional regulator GlxA family with amidase domain